MPLSAIQAERYQELLEQKVARVSALLAPFAAPAPDVFPSPPLGFRMRAEFRVWHEGDELDYVMFRRDDPKTPVAVTEFPIACQPIQQLMPPLIQALRANQTLRKKLFQVEFLSSLAGESLVTLAYHRRLDEQWRDDASDLAQELGISIVGRSRKQKEVIRADFITEILPIHGRDYRYQQIEQAFSQPNAQVNIRMIEWARACAQPLEGDLLELYCGNGNFTLPLAELFDNVIATELAKSSVRAARQNLIDNAIENVQMIRLSAQEVTQAMNGVREFRRLAELPKPLADYKLRTLFVDPPRAGLDPHTVSMAAAFDSVIYISCNPHTLADNLAQLCASHDITRFALFDQFPYTDHMECGVLLQRKR